MQTNLIEKARSSRVAALANLSTKRDVTPASSEQTRHQRFERACVLRKNIPIFRNKMAGGTGYAQLA